jgi:MFS family permease
LRVVTTAAATGRLRSLEALRHRDFRLLWIGQTVSLIGDAAFVTALGWRTFTLAGTGRFGVVLTCQAAAQTTTMLLGGALADRYPRRTLMIVSDLARLVVVAALAGLDATGHLDFTSLVVLATLMGLGDGFFYPAFGGMVPLLVDPPSIPSANSLIGVARWSSLLVGPSLAAFLYGGFGSATVFAIEAGSFLVSALFVWRTRPRAVEAAAREGTFSEIRSGIRYVASVPWLWVTIALFGFVLMLQFAPQQVLMPKLVREQWGRGVTAYGLLTTMLGVGTIIGTLLYGHFQPRRNRGVVSYMVWVLNSVSIFAFALSPWYPLAAGLMVFRGICIGFAVAIWETMLMELVPPHLLSRVVSLDYFGSFGLMPVGLAVTAAVAGVADPRTLIASGAAISTVLFLLVLTRPWLRDVH